MASDTLERHGFGPESVARLAELDAERRGVYADLEEILPRICVDPREAGRFMVSPNPNLDGEAPIELLGDPDRWDDLKRVAAIERGDMAPDDQSGRR